MFVLNRILRALEYLHTCGIVYNDLKPDNVMIGADSFTSIVETTTVKLIDFGLAFKHGDPLATKVNGSADWMPPEIFAKPNIGKTYASDIYVFGLLIYSVFSGTFLFTYDRYQGDYARQYELLCDRRSRILEAVEGMTTYRGIKESIIACLSHKPLYRPTANILLEDEFFGNPPALRTRSLPLLTTTPRVRVPYTSSTRDST